MLPPTIVAALSKVEDLLSQNTIDGLSATIIYKSRVLWEFHKGKTSRTSNTSITSTTGFRIASITKLFATSLLFLARDKGLISIDQDVADIVPGFAPINPWNKNPQKSGITFMNLAAHMAGLPKDTPCEIFCNYTSQDMIQRTKEKSEMLILPPSVRPNYSNLGFSILGNFISEFVLKYPNFEQAVIAEIIKPLGLVNTGVKITPSVVQHLADGYNGSDPNPVPNTFDLGWDSPAGQMYSCSSDLAKLLSVIISSSNFFSESSRELFYNTIAYTNPDGITSQGFAWEIEYRDNYLFRSKLGSMPGYNSGLFVVSELSLGVVLLFSHAPTQVKSLLVSIFDILVPPLVEFLSEIPNPPKYPDDPVNYIGNFTSVHPLFGTANAVISLQENSKGDLQLLFTLYFDGVYPGILLPTEFDPSDKTLLQINVPPEWYTCDLREYNGVDRQYVFFEYNSGGNAVTSFTIPGFAYSMVFNKVS